MLKLLHVTRPESKSRARLTITVKKPPKLNPPLAFPTRPPSKKYRRKRALRPYTGSDRIIFSHAFATKPVDYVALLITHGSSRETPSSDLIENPRFKTEYDYISTTKHGDAAAAYHIPQTIYKRICTTINEPRKMFNEPFTGAELMHALRSNLHFGFGIFDEPTDVSGKFHKKHTFFKQHDEGSNVSDLNIFQDGCSNFQQGICGIYLFKIDEECDDPADHNAMTVSPEELFNRNSRLQYVAETAQKLQSFIEPTANYGVIRVQNTSAHPKYCLDHPQYQLKENKGTVYLSDVLGKKGIFPPNTVVIGHVCRGIHPLSAAQYDSAVSSDYTMSSSSHKDDGDFNWEDDFEGGAVKRTTRKKRRLVNITRRRSRRARARP
jgi:hypothetical protein